MGVLTHDKDLLSVYFVEKAVVMLRERQARTIKVALLQSNQQLQYWFYGSFIQHKCILLSVNVIMHNVEKTELTISYTTMP